MTYLALNLTFVFVTVVVMRLLKIPKARCWYIALVPLLILTALFDPLIIHFNIVGYDQTKILGLLWFGAPVEDFMYSLLAVMLVPSLWNHLRERDKHV